jgi:hypothetical protein
MVSATNRNRSLKVLLKNFGEKVFYPVTDRPSEARMRSQLLTFPFAF